MVSLPSVPSMTSVSTPANWDRPQSVTLTAFGDLDTTDDSATITVSSAGLAPVNVRATVLDLGASVETFIFGDGFD